MAGVGLLLGVGLVGAVLVGVGARWLEGASGELARHYGLPRLVQGAVVAVVGSSAPELAGAVISTVRHGEFELGVALIVGSAVFNVLVIPALSALLTDGPLDISRDVVFKEAQFYMLSSRRCSSRSRWPSSTTPSPATRCQATSPGHSRSRSWRCTASTSSSSTSTSATPTPGR